MVGVRKRRRGSWLVDAVEGARVRVRVMGMGMRMGTGKGVFKSGSGCESGGGSRGWRRERSKSRRRLVQGSAPINNVCSRSTTRRAGRGTGERRRKRGCLGFAFVFGEERDCHLTAVYIRQQGRRERKKKKILGGKIEFVGFE